MDIDIDPAVDLPLPGLDLPESELHQRFADLQQRLVPLWSSIGQMSADEQTIVVVPSLTVDYDLHGALLQAYEERFLFLLLLLRQPRARVVYVTSQAILPSVIDYYLCLLPGVIVSHARERLHLVSPMDGSSRPLSVKLLQRPHLLDKIRKLIPNPERAHLVPFNTTTHERDLSMRLGIPMFGADPRYLDFGTKSGCRKLFADAGISFPMGFEGLRSRDEVVDALRQVRRERPDIEQVMVKLNEGVSGDGNAVLSLVDLDPEDRAAVSVRLETLQYEASGMDAATFFGKLENVGGIVEERILGDDIRSPSVQLRATPMGGLELLSTHDQLLGGATGQTYLGCVFPADEAYAALISEEAAKVGKRLAEAGVLGRFAIDFVLARHGDEWRSYAIELNLRKGGTTHPFLTLQFLTDGAYDARTATFATPSGHNKYFVATDYLASPSYRVFNADDLFDIAVRQGLHFDQTRETGVVFHMISCLGEAGRIGLTAVGDSAEEAERFYRRTKDVLDEEAAAALSVRPLPA